MAQKQGFSHRQGQSQRQAITAHLAQTMSLLTLNGQELEETVESRLAENPALKMEKLSHCPTCNRPLRKDRLCTHCAFSGKNGEPAVFISARRDLYHSTSNHGEEAVSFEDFSAQDIDLATYVLQQIGPELDKSQQIIAVHIMTNLDDNGLLDIPIIEIARYLHERPSNIEAVLTVIQGCEPIGIGSRNAQEAMLVQAKLLASGHQIPDCTIETLENHYHLLTKKQFDKLAEVLNTSPAHIEKIVDFVTHNLNPYPSRAHWGNQRHHVKNDLVRYQKPDVVINPAENGNAEELSVEVLWPLRGKLEVNPKFIEAMKDAPEDKKEEWQKAIDQAHLLVKCIGQRNHTLLRLMQLLVVEQQDYILHGAAHMKPLTRASLADELDVHEGTISRAVASKTVQLPSGKIVPIAKFFDRSLHIRTALKSLVNAESKPLSDTKLAKKLQEQGYNIARRTVAKYRAMEGILPAYLRS